MTDPLPPHPADAAAQLDDRAIHVWHLGYRRASGRRPLLRLLAAYLGVDGDELSLAQDAHGRPRLDSSHGQALDFNWSHSGEHALVALARGIAPGIDIERRRPRPRALALARRFFDAAEADALAALPEGARDEAFLALWTAKEAVLKAHGRGIGYGLQRLRVAVPPQPLRLLRFENEDVDAWQLRPLDVAPELVAALAWRGAARTVRLASLPAAMLADTA
ncbi:4'-phosphopantetheinyl transferase family protein [Rhodanobacter lindaniclasticus]